MKCGRGSGVLAWLAFPVSAKEMFSLPAYYHLPLSSNELKKKRYLEKPVGAWKLLKFSWLLHKVKSVLY